MFGLSKKRKAEKAQGYAVSLSVAHLKHQLDLTGYIIKSGLRNDKTEFMLGYVHGVCDAHVQALKIDNEIAFLTCLVDVCHELFGDEAAQRMSTLALELSHSNNVEMYPKFYDGMMLGGTEASDWLSNSSKGVDPPPKYGLAKYLGLLDSDNV